jgi:hypothetical protein
MQTVGRPSQSLIYAREIQADPLRETTKTVQHNSFTLDQADTEGCD